MDFCLPRRDMDSNKGDFGHLLIVGGSRGMAGSVFLAAMGALRSGAGLVTAASPRSVFDALSIKLTEAMNFCLEEKDGMISETAIQALLPLIKKSSHAIIGPGLSTGDCCKKFFFSFLEKYDKPIIIDADGLNCLSEDLSAIKRGAVLTPHPAEMSRLVKIPVLDIQQNREEIAGEFAREHGCTVLLKGKDTVVASVNGEIFVNTTGNPGLAKGGSGDLLTGIIAGFMAIGLSGFEAAKYGAYYHGKAADILLERYSEHSILASDLLNILPEIYRGEQ